MKVNKLQALANLTIFAIVCYLAIWRFSFLPYGDLPLHIYMSKILNNPDLFEGSYSIRWSLCPNLIWQVLLSFALDFVDPITAAKLILTTNLLLSTLGLFLLLRVFINTPPLWIWNILLLAQLHYFYQCGYLQFTLTLGIIPYLLIALEKFRNHIGARCVVFVVATIITCLMHFMGLLVLYFSILMIEMYFWKSENTKDIVQTYAPGILLVIAFVLINILIIKGRPMSIHYQIFRKFANLYLYCFRPLPLQFFTLVFISGMGCIALLNRKYRFEGRFLLIIIVALSLYVVCPTDIGLSADSDIRLLYPIIICFLFYALSALVRAAAWTKILTGIWFVAAIVVTLAYYNYLGMKADELCRMSAYLEGDNYILYINHNQKTDFMKSTFLPRGNSLFYMYAYHFYLEPTRYRPQDHVPYIFTTSILERGNEFQGYYRDYVPPWGEITDKLVSARETIQDVKHIVMPISGIEDYDYLLAGRHVISGKYWALASRED